MLYFRLWRNGRIEATLKPNSAYLFDEEEPTMNESPLDAEIAALPAYTDRPLLHQILGRIPEEVRKPFVLALQEILPKAQNGEGVDRALAVRFHGFDAETLALCEKLMSGWHPTMTN